MPRIYSKTGDDGTTSLAEGQRLGKESTRIETIGNIDELNAVLGVVIASAPELKQVLQPVQSELFELGAELAAPGTENISLKEVHKLESSIDAMERRLPPLKTFILPGGSLPAAHAHQARAICRRAERSLVRLSLGETVNSTSVVYLNRLSDLLFVAARSLAQSEGEEIPWNKEI